MILVRNENFEISEENGKVFMLTFSAGFPLKEFDSILRSHPRLKLSNFSILKMCYQPRIQILLKLEVGFRTLKQKWHVIRCQPLFYI